MTNFMPPPGIEIKTQIFRIIFKNEKINKAFRSAACRPLPDGEAVTFTRLASGVTRVRIATESEFFVPVL